MRCIGYGWGARQMSQQQSRATDARIPRARQLRRHATDVEKLLWQHLRQPPFKEHHFRRQATIGAFFCDFASHRLKLVIELDGGQHADNSADAERTALLESKGYRVLRFWNNQVTENLEGVLTVLLTAVEQATQKN
jgi:very-short-patch-repair endonuclease